MSNLDTDQILSDTEKLIDLQGMIVVVADTGALISLVLVGYIDLIE